MARSKKTKTKTKAQITNPPPSAPSELIKSEDSEEKPKSIQKDSEGNQSGPAPARVPRQVLDWFRSKEKPAAIWIPVLLSAVSLIIAWTYSRYEKRQWESMQSSNEEVRLNRELEYRAYVVVKTVRFIVRKDIPVLGDIIVTEFNSGRTPGVGTIKTKMDILKEPPADDAPIPNPEFQSRIVFAPQVDVNTTVAAFPVQQEMPTQQTSKPRKPVKPVNPPAAAAGSGKPVEEADFLKDKKIYIYGRIDYVDIFTKQRWTKFCFVNTPGTESWSYCPTYNATDQQDQVGKPN